MAKRKVSKASKKRLIFWGIPSLFVILYFLFSLFYNAYELYSLEIELKSLKNTYVQLQEEAEELKIDIEKLNDEKYLADYARENYLYSKDGEYILQLADDIGKTNNDLEIINIKIKQEYILIIFGILTALIFLYILLKGKKNRNY